MTDFLDRDPDRPRVMTSHRHAVGRGIVRHGEGCGAECQAVSRERQVGHEGIMPQSDSHHRRAARSRRRTTRRRHGSIGASASPVSASRLTALGYTRRATRATCRSPIRETREPATTDKRYIGEIAARLPAAVSRRRWRRCDDGARADRARRRSQPGGGIGGGGGGVGRARRATATRPDLGGCARRHEHAPEFAERQRPRHAAGGAAWS